MFRIPAFLKRRFVEEDLAEEIRQHMEERGEQLMREEGMSREEAELRARRAFGNATLAAERSREVWQWRTLEEILADVKYAARQMRSSPGFAVTVVLLLGLGIGATTAVFSLVNAVLLKPLPYPDTASLVIPWNIPPAGVDVGGFDVYPWGQNHFRWMEKERATYKYLSAFQGARFNLTGNGDPLTLEGALVTWEFFPALGVKPELGRTFTQQEDTPGNAREVVLSDAVWRSRFGGAASVVGKTIALDGAPYTVVGVMPAGFGFPRASEMPALYDFGAESELWVPMAMPAVTPPYTPSELAFVGRLQRGVSVPQAQAAMNLFAGRIDRAWPVMKGWSQSRVTPMQQQIAGDARRPLLLILGAVGVVLLVVCFNIAGLLLARGIARSREFTLRTALGARRTRLLKQMLVESLLLAFLGGGLGVAVAALGIEAIKRLGPQQLPRLHEVSLDLHVLSFAAALTLLTGIIFGFAPALGATRVDLAGGLKDGGQRQGAGAKQSHLRGLLVVSQMALALVLVFSAGLLVRSFSLLLATDPGFRPEHVLTFSLSLPTSGYSARDAIARFYQKALPQLRAVPGVRALGITEAVPMGGATESTVIRVVGRPAPKKGTSYPIVNYTIGSPELFAAMGTPLLAGREFLDSDTLTAPQVTIVNHAMAEHLWPHESALGKQVIVPSQRVPATVVGVVADVKRTSLREVPEPEMFEPYTQNVWPSMARMQVVIRTQSDPASVIGGMRVALRSLDAGLPMAKVTTLSTLESSASASERFSMLTLGFFGGLALLLAAVGIFGLVSYSVTQQTREIGIRMALGSSRSGVFQIILTRILRLAAVGAALGVVAALGVGRVLSSYLFGVKAYDPVTLCTVVLLLTGASILAGFLPARRAASIDPMTALRAE
ncbi:ADOP family duplicated permease [Silvibacterium sp.]|uniref:ABC transporter permease n=1 Tax=Silvibacterium sp. TaxID=1964179 RepID=UPI0039E31D0D